MVINSLEIAPSILGGDHSALADSVAKIAEAGLSWVHVDVMDSTLFRTFLWAGVVKSLKSKFPNLFYDHLMLDNPAI
ncbi:MAG: hypothetical protein ACLUKN_03805 [Bacilli bacterium]